MDKHATQINEEISDAFVALNSSFPGHDQCFVGDTLRSKFWYGITRLSTDGGWVDPRYPTQELFPADDIPISNYEINKCSYYDGNKIHSVWCDFIFPCGVCEIPRGKWYYLKGLCNNDLDKIYDFHYYIYGVSDQRPYFKYVFFQDTFNFYFIFFFFSRGVSKSNIYFNGTSQRWRLQSLLQPSKFMETEGDLSSLIPIGSYSWKTGSHNSWCSKPEGFTTDLTFSQCFPNKYTCDSGYCIPLHQRCNTELNCEDKSDENNCHTLVLEENYNKRVPPITSADPISVCTRRSKQCKSLI